MWKKTAQAVFSEICTDRFPCEFVHSRMRLIGRSLFFFAIFFIHLYFRDVKANVDPLVWLVFFMSDADVLTPVTS